MPGVHVRYLLMRVLDLGCGFGRNIGITRISASDEIVGVDIVLDRLQSAAKKYPSRKFVHARAEQLPFHDEAFSCIVCEVSMPYMNIPAALAEINRTLKPGGTVHISLHALRFTMHELTLAFPRPKALLFRLWVLVNGLILHFTGKPVGIAGRYESFQTHRGISIALKRTGFVEIVFTRPRDNFTKQLVVSARRPDVISRGVRPPAYASTALL
jgi:ubiquinone/menaquinone biosynthesis C-methylase UbiE